jgi:glycine/serine hydroxymethyltransferase
MKGLELLTFLTDKQLEFIEVAELSYRRFARIYFQILSFENNEIILKVWQTETPDKIYLSAKDLALRAKDMFAGKIPVNIKLHIRPVPFDPLKNFSTSDIRQEMTELGLKAKDLVKLLDISKSTISMLLSENRNMSKPTKAMFYYLFKYLKTNKVS